VPADQATKEMDMNRNWIALAGLLMCSAAAFGQYKYVGPNGEVTYSDIPPPPTAKDVQVKSFGARIATADLPYDVRQAATKYPVTLYSGDSCPACDQARTYLKSRGIPYLEKTITTPEDLDALKKVTKDTNLPLLTVGSQKMTGFTEGALGSLLDDAGYPAASKLPQGYVNPAAEPAAPRPTDTAAAPGGAAARPPAAPSLPPPAAGNAPPGFQF